MSNDLYHDPIIEWSKRKEYMGTLDKADCRATENNRLCGDQVSVEIKLYRDRIKEIAFHVRGCILAKAAAAHLAFLAIGRDRETLGQLRRSFAKALKAKEKEFPLPESHDFFEPVRSRKSRHSCVLLPYDATMQALRGMVVEQVLYARTFSTGLIPSKISFHKANLDLSSLTNSAPGTIPSRVKQPTRADVLQAWALQAEP